MGASNNQKIAIVYGTLAAVEELEQFAPFIQENNIDIISSESIIGYLSQNSRYQNINCVVLPDHDDNSSFLPGLEQALEGYTTVIVKERIGIYAYQAVKAKFRHKFRLLTWVDNLCPLAGEDIQRMRTVRAEITTASDGFIVQSQAARNTLLAESIADNRIHHLTPYAHKFTERDAKTRAAACQALDVSDGDFVIGFYGQVEWEENLLELLHAIKIASDQDRALAHRLKLVICGIGSFSNEIKQRALSLSMDDRVKYLVPNSDSVTTLFQAADCFYTAYLSSRDRIDGDPFKLLAPMAHGIPLLAPRSPLIEETADKHRIDFCQGSAGALATALTKLVYSPGLGKDIAQKNLDKMDKRFNQAKFSTDWQGILAVEHKVEVAPSLSTIDQLVLQVEGQIGSAQYVEAISIIERVFAQKDVPVHHQANLYRMIGDCFTRLGDNDGAKNAYLQALELDPFAAKAHIGLGTLSLTKNNYDIGVIHFQKAVSLAPKDEMATLGLGLSFQGLDELTEANKWVAKALEINPENTAAIYTIVKLAQDRDEYKDAEKALRRYLKLHPNDANLAYTLGGLLLQDGKLEDAMSIAEEILASNPMDGRAQSLIRQAKRSMTKKAQNA